MRQINAVSLFSGAGGMDVGFLNAGYNIVVASEIDKYACETFRANHQKTALIEGDINNFLGTLDNYQGVDLVLGGPPCQGFSVAGKMNPNDPRSKLIFSFCQVTERLSPKVFVMENVSSFASLDKFACVRTRLINRFQEAGYFVKAYVLNSKDFGVSQSRERVFFIGTRSELQLPSFSAFSPYRKAASTLREVLTPLGKPGTVNNDKVCNAKITLATNPILRKSPYAGMLFNGQGRPLNSDGLANTLPASMGGNRTPIIDNNNLYDGDCSWVEEYHHYLMSKGKSKVKYDIPSYLRRVTANEAALLQTFPSDYIFCGPISKVFSQIGNAVPCILANVVAEIVKSTFFVKN
jgi:DNA (cytosine-5)-methyltransferase 1